MFLAESVAKVTDAAVGLPAVMILFVGHEVGGTEDYMVMDMPFVYMCRKDVRMPPFKDPVSQLFSDIMSLLLRDLSG